MLQELKRFPLEGVHVTTIPHQSLNVWMFLIWCVTGNWWQYHRATHPLAFEASVFSSYFSFNWLHFNAHSSICSHEARLGSFLNRKLCHNWLINMRTRNFQREHKLSKQTQCIIACHYMLWKHLTRSENVWWSLFVVNAFKRPSGTRWWDCYTITGFWLNCWISGVSSQKLGFLDHNTTFQGKSVTR